MFLPFLTCFSLSLSLLLLLLLSSDISDLSLVQILLLSLYSSKTKPEFGQSISELHSHPNSPLRDLRSRLPTNRMSGTWNRPMTAFDSALEKFDCISGFLFFLLKDSFMVKGWNDVEWIKLGFLCFSIAVFGLAMKFLWFGDGRSQIQQWVSWMIVLSSPLIWWDEARIFEFWI